ARPADGDPDRPDRLGPLTQVVRGGDLSPYRSTRRDRVRDVRFTSSDAEQRYAALVAVAGTTVVGLDFDGTLAPIVDDPESAHIHPDAPAVLLDLSAVVRAVAVV